MGSRLFIADELNHRVLIFQNVPAASNAAADYVVGQPNFTQNSANQGGGPAANTLDHPYRIDGTTDRLLVSDLWNSRVLIYNPIPTANNAAASVEIGQPDMNTNGHNTGGLGPASLYDPYHASTDGTRVFVTDMMNNRILIFAGIPTTDHASADLVLGQPDMTHNGVNQNTTPTARTLNNPRSATYYTGELWVADETNHRVLRFDDPLPGLTPTPTVTAAVSPSATATVPPGFFILQNRVQPGRGEFARFRLSLTQTVRVHLRLYDVTGRLTATLLDQDLPPGDREIVWTGEDAGSGVYFVSCEAGGVRARGKLVVIR